MAERLLEVKGLRVRFATEDGTVHAVDGVDFELDRGKVLGIAGESGFSATARSLFIAARIAPICRSFMQAKIIFAVVSSRRSKMPAASSGFMLW